MLPTSPENTIFFSVPSSRSQSSMQAEPSRWPISEKRTRRPSAIVTHSPYRQGRKHAAVPFASSTVYSGSTGGSPPPPANINLPRQQLLLQRASIGTVDAFCLHFVQQNFSALDVPPDFTIADDATLVRLQQETLSTVLEQAYTDPDFCAFADLYDRGRTDDTTGRAVQELYHFTQALPHPAQALQRFVEMWQSDAPPEKTQWGQAVLRETSARIKGVLRLLRTAQKIAAKDPAADKALTAVLMDDEDRMLLVLDRLDHGAWDTVPEALDNADNWRRAGRVPGGIVSNIAAMSANMLRDRAKKQIATLRTDFLLCPAADYQADRRRAAPLVAGPRSGAVPPHTAGS